MNNNETMLRIKWIPENKMIEIPTGFCIIRVFGIETYEQMARQISYIITHDLLIPGLKHEGGKHFELDI